MSDSDHIIYIEEAVEFTEADYEKLRKYVPRMAIVSGRAEWMTKQVKVESATWVVTHVDHVNRTITLNSRSGG